MDKKKALEASLAGIEKAYGKGAVMRLGQNVGMTVESIPTGAISLDIALGIGGVPEVGLLKYMALSLQVKLQLLCMLLHKLKSWR